MSREYIKIKEKSSRFTVHREDTDVLWTTITEVDEFENEASKRTWKKLLFAHMPMRCKRVQMHVYHAVE